MDSSPLPDRVGGMIEERLDRIEARAGALAIGPALLGIAAALAVVAGGIAAFAAVLFVLVQFFA